MTCERRRPPPGSAMHASADSRGLVGRCEKSSELRRTRSVRRLDRPDVESSLGSRVSTNSLTASSLGTLGGASPREQVGAKVTRSTAREHEEHSTRSTRSARPDGQRQLQGLRKLA